MKTNILNFRKGVLKSKTLQRRYVFLTFLFIQSSVLFSQQYEGVLGKYPVFLNLEADYEADYFSAYYFYKSSLQNIKLEGEYDGEFLYLYELFSDKEDKIELFKLKQTEGKLIGSWENKTTLLNVELTANNQDLEKYKHERLAFSRDTITKVEGKEFVWIKERYTEPLLFRLGNGFSASQREYLNPILDEIQKRNALIDLECNGLEYNPTIEFVSNTYLSFSVYSSVFCGGAHPSHGITGYNFDLVNKTRVTNFSEIYPNIDFFELLKTKHDGDSNLHNECDYFSDTSNWEDPVWFFTEDGVNIIPWFPHAMTACREEFLLTYEELE